MEKWKERRNELKAIWENFFKPPEVFTEQLPHNNRKFCTRYYSKSKEAAVATAQARVDAIDPYRSPHCFAPYERDGFWNVVVCWYSLD